MSKEKTKEEVEERNLNDRGLPTMPTNFADNMRISAFSDPGPTVADLFWQRGDEFSCKEGAMSNIETIEIQSQQSHQPLTINLPAEVLASCEYSRNEAIRSISRNLCIVKPECQQAFLDKAAEQFAEMARIQRTCHHRLPEFKDQEEYEQFMQNLFRLTFEVDTSMLLEEFQGRYQDAFKRAKLLASFRLRVRLDYFQDVLNIFKEAFPEIDWR